MKTKRFWIVLLALWLGLFSFSAALAEDGVLFDTSNRDALEEEEGTEEEEEYIWVESMASDGQVLYMLANLGNMQNLYQYRPGDEAPALVRSVEYSYMYQDPDSQLTEEELAIASENITRLLGGDQVVAINTSTGWVGTVDASGVTWSEAAFEFPEMTVRERDYYYTRDDYGSFVMDGKLFLALNGEDWNSCELSMYDLNTGAKEGEWTLPGFRSITPYQDGQILSARMNEENGEVDVVAYDYQNQTETVLIKSMFQRYSQPAGLIYDGASDSIYYTIDSQVFRITALGDPVPVAFMAGSYYYSSMPVALIGDTYALMTYEGVLLRSIDQDVSEVQAIRITGGWMPEVISNYAKQHPEVPVIALDRYFSTSEEVSTAIMTGEDEIDLFNTSISYGGFGALKEKGYMADLSDNSILVNFVDSLYPAIGDLCRDSKGNVVAIPYSTYVSTWTVDTTLWEQEYPGQELPQTWDEWLDLLIAWEETHSEEDEYGFFRNYDPKQDLYYNVYNQFIALSDRDGKALDFSDPIFRGVMEKIASLPFENTDWENMTEEENEELNRFVNSRSIFQTYGGDVFVDPQAETFSWDDSYGDSLQMPYLLPVFTADQEPVATLQMDLMFVNPNSSNIEGAKDLLAYTVQNLDSQTAYMLNPSLTEPAVNKDYETNIRYSKRTLTELEKQLAEAEPEDVQALEDELERYTRYVDWFERTNKYSITQGALDYYRENIGPYLYASSDSLFGAYDGENSPAQVLQEILWRYISEQISLDEMIGEMTQKARMIEQENR